MAGVAAVRAPPAQGSATGTPGQAVSRRARTPAQKGNNPRSDRRIARRIAPIVFTGASESDSLIVAMESLCRSPDL
jgi:hypothetical protein